MTWDLEGTVAVRVAHAEEESTTKALGVLQSLMGTDRFWRQLIAYKWPGWIPGIVCGG